MRIDYDFSRPNERFIIPVEYILDKSSLKVTVVTGEIEEYGESGIGEISLLPYSLCGEPGEDGYILIPDGSGALIDFSTVNPNASAYKQRVYGRDPAMSYYYDEGTGVDIIMPVFGICCGGRGTLAVIDGNEAAACVSAECTGISSSYSRVYASFVYRVYDTVTISGSDWRYKEYVVAAEDNEEANFSVTYNFLDNGSYADMALAYRDMLEKEGRLTETLDCGTVMSSALKFYGVTEQKASFLEIPYTEKVVATSFEDVEDILSNIGSKYGKTGVFLKDFDKDSYSGNYADSSGWLTKAGGDRAYGDLLDKFSGSCEFFRITDVIYERCTSFMWIKQYRYAQTVGKDHITESSYSLVTYERQQSDRYALNLKQLTSRPQKLFKKISALENKVGLALQYIGNTLYGDYKSGSFMPRERMIEAYKTIVSNAAEYGTDTAIQGGNAYAIGFSDTYYDYPAGSSELIISSQTVPFAQIVLHGYANMVSSPLNFELDPETAFLNCMEYGMVPMFAVTGESGTKLRRTDYKYLYGTCYDDISLQIKEKVDLSSELAEKTGTAKITAPLIEGEIRATVYDNGITVAVNYRSMKNWSMRATRCLREAL